MIKQLDVVLEYTGTALPDVAVKLTGHGVWTRGGCFGHDAIVASNRLAELLASRS